LGDEYITVQRGLTVSQSDFYLQPPSTLSISAAQSIFSVSEWSAGLPAAVVGGLSVPVLFFLVRQVIDSTAALLAGLRLAVSPWHIYWSQRPGRPIQASVVGKDPSPMLQAAARRPNVTLTGAVADVRPYLQ
jgi:hypothetical protein